MDLWVMWKKYLGEQGHGISDRVTQHIRSDIGKYEKHLKTSRFMAAKLLSMKDPEVEVANFGQDVIPTLVDGMLSKGEYQKILIDLELNRYITRLGGGRMLVHYPEDRPR